MKKWFHFIRSFTILAILVACQTSSGEVLYSKPVSHPSVTSTSDPSHTPVAHLELPVEKTPVTTIAIEDECSEAETQTEMNECAEQSLERYQQQLEKLIYDLHEHMLPEQHEELLVTQEKWEEVVESHCQWNSKFFKNGSISSMQYTNCKSSQYQQRMNELSIHLCEGHGLTGKCEEALRYAP